MGLDTTLELKSGEQLIVPEPTRIHLQAHPEVWDHIKEAALKLESKNRQFIVEEIDFKRTIGLSGAARLPKCDIKNDKLQFAKRKGRKNWSRVVVQPGVSCSTVVIIAFRKGKHYNLITAYVGWEAEREPTDPELKIKDFQKCLKFWSSYALIYDSSIMGPIKTMTWADAIFGD